MTNNRLSSNFPTMNYLCIYMQPNTSIWTYNLLYVYTLHCIHIHSQWVTHFEALENIQPLYSIKRITFATMIMIMVMIIHIIIHKRDVLMVQQSTLHTHKHNTQVPIFLLSYTISKCSYSYIINIYSDFLHWWFIVYTNYDGEWLSRFEDGFHKIWSVCRTCVHTAW